MLPSGKRYASIHSLVDNDDFPVQVVCSLIGCRFETCANLLKQCQSDQAVRLLIEYLDNLEFLPLWLNDDLKVGILQFY